MWPHPFISAPAPPLFDPPPSGVCREQPAVGAGGGAWAEPGEGGGVGGGRDEAHGEWQWQRGRGQAETLVGGGGGGTGWGRGRVGGASGVPGVLPAGGGPSGLGAHGAERLCPLSQRGRGPLPLHLPAHLHPLPVCQPAAHVKPRPLCQHHQISRRHRHVLTNTC